MNLTDLYESHGGFVSDKWSSYVAVYDRVFAPYRNQPLALLEIGVQNGGSLEIWAKYFSQAISIVGCEKNHKSGNLTYSDPRIKVIIGDINAVTTRKKLSVFTPRPDIIIDDGSHTANDILNAFEHLYPSLAPGGVYIVEDLHCSYWRRFGGGLWRKSSPIEYFKRLVDVVNAQSWGAELPRGRRHLGGGGRRILVERYRSIESVTFYNSLCVVAKGNQFINDIGPRLIVGKHAEVDSALPLAGSPMQVPLQPRNARRLRRG